MPISEAYNCDCMEYMRSIPDKFFDLVVVDPEYGLGIANRKGSIGQKKGQGKITSYQKKKWDTKRPDALYFTELFRISKNQIIWGGNYFSDYLPPSKCWIVWDKKQPEGVSFAMAELAYTSFDFSTKMFSCSRKYIGNKISNNTRLAQQYRKHHPTQKPIQLYAWIYSIFAQKGWKIYDSHLGSGTNRIAAYLLGFDFYATEIDTDIYNDSIDFFNQECFGQIKTKEGTIIQQSLF